VIGKIVSVFGNMVIAETDGKIVQNSIGYCCRNDGARLLSEVIRVRGRMADLQVFEATRGLKIGDEVEFRDQMLSVTLGPGLLGNIYDGLQNPLMELAEECGFFLQPGMYLHGLNTEVKWDYTPVAAVGATVEAGDTIGTVPEGIFTHPIMAPFDLDGQWTVKSAIPPGAYNVETEVARLTGGDGRELSVTMQQDWPVKVPLSVCRKRLMPSEPMVTKVRIIDSMFPVVKGATY